MIARGLLALALLCWAGLASAQEARILYLGVADDPYYEPQKLYTGLSLRDRERPVDGARVAMRGTRVLGRALGVAFALDEVLLGPEDDAAAAIREAREGGALAVLLDLPAERMAAALKAEGGAGLLFNIRDPDARWRGADCAPALLHTIPSRAMLSDALAQLLRARNWGRVLLLHGPTEEDAKDAEAVRRSAAKFGLTIADDRAFELTNDPRKRDRSNVALLTGGARYDVVWLVDSVGEVGRYVPYATQQPRPVIGSEGLRAEAWHWTWERYGAPQLNQRFRREAGRDMTSEDWAAWVAVRAVIEAVTQTKGTDPDAVAAAIRSGEIALDLYKGVRGSFRPWNGQLRQPILLATHDAVIDRPPLEGFEHRTDTLDTLGLDEAENTCPK